MNTPEQPDGLAPASETSMGATPQPGRPAWGLAILAAIVAGVASWGVVEGIQGAYAASFEPESKPYPSAADMVRITRARIVSGTIGYGATGALVGLALGLAGGASRKSGAAALKGGLAGLVVGGLAEAGVAFGGLSFIYKQMDLQADDMLQTLLSHEALWVVVGLAGGLAFGVGRGGWARAAVGGLIGAAIATVAYEFLGALGFPNDGTHQPYSNTPITRSLAQVLIPLGAALGAAASSIVARKRAKA
jgi:hypothetical protein